MWKKWLLDLIVKDECLSVEIQRKLPEKSFGYCSHFSRRDDKTKYTYIYI